MATLFDFRQFGSDETLVRIDSYLNGDGNVVVNLKSAPDDDENPTVYLLMGLIEAKELRAKLLEAINLGVGELTVDAE